MLNTAQWQVYGPFRNMLLSCGTSTFPFLPVRVWCHEHLKLEQQCLTASLNFWKLFLEGLSRCWKDSMLVFSVWSRCKWIISILNVQFFLEFKQQQLLIIAVKVALKCCELMAASMLRLLGKFLKHDLVTPGKKLMKTSASVISESRRFGNIWKSSFIWHCMRTPGCAALMEPMVRNNGALNGRRDRDNRQEEEENGKIKKQKGKKLTSALSNRQGNKEEAAHHGKKAPEMCSLRA